MGRMTTGEGEVLRPSTRRVGAQIPATVAGAVVSGQQLLTSAGAWQVISGLAALLFLALLVVALVHRRRDDTRVDGYGLTLPGKGVIPWSTVEQVTDRPHGSRQKFWFLVLRDGTKQHTPFPSDDDTLYRWWKGLERGH